MRTTFEDDITPEYERTQIIGNEQFSFYYPIEIGTVVLYIWTRSKKLHQFSGQLLSRKTNVQLPSSPFESNLRYSVSIYENGKNLLTVRDPRFRRFRWAQKVYTSWSEEKFTKNEIEDILCDLRDLALEEKK